MSKTTCLMTFLPCVDAPLRIHGTASVRPHGELLSRRNRIMSRKNSHGTAACSMLVDGGRGEAPLDA